MNLDKNNDVTPDILALRRDPNRGYRVWRSTEIYFGGTETKGLYVPNINDKIDFYEGSTLIEKRVIDVDESTLIPTLEDIIRPEATDLNQTNVFTGVGVGAQSETWRVFYDNKVVPHTLMIDSNFHLYGVDLAYIKVFKGRDITKAGRVISQWRENPTSHYVENVPLRQLSNRFDSSKAIKRPDVFHTTEHLETGDEVTIVSYTNTGSISSICTMLVAHASNIRQLEEHQAYVMGIELISPFISQTDDRLIEIPINMPLAGLFTRAKVYYSDGTERVLTIDGGRMAVPGLEYYVATREGEINRLALRYQLGDNEHAWNTSSGEARHITEIYRYKTVAVPGTYAVMLNVIPQWNKSTQQYELRYFLHNLDRTVSFEVTDYIEQGVNSDIFDGKRFGRMQHINVAIQLERLDIGLKPFRYVQQFEIGLNGRPENFDSPFLINYSNNQPVKVGEYHQALALPDIEDTDKIVNFNGYIKQIALDNWLNMVYYSSEPQFDLKVELKAPTPTHFVLSSMDGRFEKEYTIDNWNRDIKLNDSDGSTFSYHDQLLMQFVRKQGNTTQYLNIVPWILKPQQ